MKAALTFLKLSFYALHHCGSSLKMVMYFFIMEKDNYLQYFQISPAQ